MTYEEALTYLTAHGQQHLLRYYPTLTPAQQEHLLEQISNLPRVCQGRFCNFIPEHTA